MTAEARHFIEFWVENSVHAAEPYGAIGAEQNVAELARRCIQMAAEQGISEQELTAEIGDVIEFIKEKLTAANPVMALR
ncbi:hypothetical protein IVB14_01700 [Bradyrhizobium sp. 180]|uniref:hypothetical protein n=1 Tax=Bradyrhizobium sp. 180 TaxID=2782650 RepID=UPI001FFB04E8|nr:hypothetical protein [Bradyrhizobium sp. 180]MCK1489176.1 hypothetical protein [Bradyrhizobium sp. 180]